MSFYHSMKKKEYKLGSDARSSIANTAVFIGDLLGKTLGPAGRNYFIPAGITNDGASILAHARFDDECDDNVSVAFHEIAKRTDMEGGDGTTTSVVIGAKLVQTLLPKVPDLDAPSAGQVSVMALGQQLDKEKDRAVELLTEKVVPVDTLDQLKMVAFTSMEDREAAEVVAEVIFEAGAHSHTALDEGFNGKLETSMQAGIEIPIKLNYGSAAQVDNAPVLVVNHIFEDTRELTPFMTTMASFMNDNPNVKFSALIIVAKKFSIPFMQRVATMNQTSAIKLICMSNDYLDDELFEDVAAFVDAKYTDTHPKSGQKITDVKFQDCGMVTRFVASPKGAVFYGGKGTQLQDGNTTTRVAARIMQLEAELAEEKDTKRRDVLAKRISEFKGGKATIYVDAKTATEKFYLKLKVQDCMNSCKTALEGGMVPGGGRSLKEIAEVLNEEFPDSLLADALIEPYRRIQQNAGGTLAIGEDVMDSFLVAEAGIRNAVSVVKTLITIEGIIADPPIDIASEFKKMLYGDE
jgi:chaperonin GroEL